MDGRLFASGGNDNLCFLTETSEVFGPGNTLRHPVVARNNSSSHGNEVLALNTARRQDPRRLTGSPQPELDTFDESSAFENTSAAPTDEIRTLSHGSEKHRWMHGAAVKAIAFCPWREGLIATGGGSNDKCIHFYHTLSGAALATIAVSAQVTSLIWSTTRREIVATFGYAQPEHPFRIAVFSWPDCKQVAAIPWEGDLRALYAIPYPNMPLKSSTGAGGRTAQEGCIVVASSDKSVKFHEVWSNEGKTTVRGVGTLGGSDILEALEGIDKEGDVIR